MILDTANAIAIPRRDPQQVMRLKRLGSLHQCRLSFMRILMRRMAREKWQFSQSEFAINDQGVGYAVYSAEGPERTYSLVAFAHELPASLRSDRVIAEAWDATFALFDGVPDDNDIARLQANVPYQEAGRVTASELTLSRANKSVRLWTHVVDSLAQGKQPDTDMINKVGYLMRTTAVYGSGKFGACDREVFAERAEMQAPFQSEMLTVFLIRTFVRDLVQHAANIQGGDETVDLDPAIARTLGIGNSTGLGMAPFLINHPVLFNNWIMVREEAIARVRSVRHASASEQAIFLDLVRRNSLLVESWHSEHPAQQQKLKSLRRDVALLQTHIAALDLGSEYVWNQVAEWTETALSEEGQELVLSLMLEPYSELVDGLESCMSDSNSDALRIDGSMAVAEVRELIKRDFGWALPLNWQDQAQCARAWYVSAEKLEPRLGERFEEPIADYEQALAPARDAVSAFNALQTYDGSVTIAEFLLKHPQHRHTVRRAQLSKIAPYGEIRDNTISSELMPIDMLRAKLSFFGATRFDPRSDRWVRITMFAGAPYPEELRGEDSDLWVYPD